MRNILLLLLSFWSLSVKAQKADWLINPKEYTATVNKIDDKTICITNGLISRTFCLAPNGATIDYRNLFTGAAIIRSIRPEAILTIDGKQYKVGGLEGQPEHAYLNPEWLKKMTADPTAFQCTGYERGLPLKPFNYVPKRWNVAGTWPAKGKSLILHFNSPQHALKEITIDIHYELYDGIPAMAKWFEIRNNSKKSIQLNTFINENLAVIEPEISVDHLGQWETPNIMITSDYSFQGMSPKSANRIANWTTDSLYTSQVNYERKTPCLLECRPPIGPNCEIKPRETFSSFKVYELIYDSYDRERKGLSVRKLYRTIAPWVTENPIFMHLTFSDPEKIKAAIDQCHEVGFEMIILSFGSGLNMESTNEAYIQKIKGLVDYAHSKGIELGGYSLLASRKISDTDDVIDPKTGKPGNAIFGNSPCLLSNWGLTYFDHIRNFIEKTGFDLLEHDGSYPGDLCASTTHPGHTGLEDSQWKQWVKICDFYKWCREKGVYLNVPDWYFAAGSSKTGIGYRETNWSLPRDRQIIIGRQNLFDGTWEKTPSMGWTFVPLTEYQGGGPAATIEPLSDHLSDYQAHLVQNFGAGVQACYRGSRIYDIEATKTMVKKWVAWYKQYRNILNADIIHLRRADGSDWDGFIHVDPTLDQKGLAMLFNPTSQAITRTITLPLYYTGLTSKATISIEGAKSFIIKLDAKSQGDVKVSIPANGFLWLTVKR
jgi:hypothetical protein